MCSKGLHSMSIVYRENKLRRACVGLSCMRQGGTELLGTKKKMNRPDPTLTRFRPEPGFFGYRIFIG